MKFDLIAGMLLPFMLATSCVVIAGASQFHTVPQPGFLEDGQSTEWEPNEQQVSEYNRLLEGRVLHEAGRPGTLSDEQVATQVEQLGAVEQRMAATLVTRDAFDLALSLQPLLGGAFSNIIFGIGVFAMALSTITIHMVICGFVVCEIMKVPYDSWYFRAGILIPSVGVLGPFFWDQALFWLAIPTSVITLMLLPIAYVTFFLMLNSEAIMKEHKPTGRRRAIWNTLMILSIVLIGTASIYMLWQYGGIWGMAALGLFLGAVAVAEWKKRMKSSPARP